MEISGDFWIAEPLKKTGRNAPAKTKSMSPRCPSLRIMKLQLTERAVSRPSRDIPWNASRFIALLPSASGIANRAGTGIIRFQQKLQASVYGASSTRFLADIRLPKAAPPPAN